MTTAQIIREETERAERAGRLTDCELALSARFAATKAAFAAMESARESGQRLVCDVDLTPPRPLPYGGEPVVTVKGRIVKIGDADESTPLAPVDSTPLCRSIADAERVFLDLCEAETGILVDPALKARKDAERAALADQSHEIARKLESQNVPAYRAEKWNLWTYGVHSGEWDAIPQFRRIAFLPAVAAQIRAPILRALEFWLQCHPHDRFWTFTSGPRCRMSKIRRRVRELHRRISQLNAEPFMKEAGAQIVFRSTELGSVETRRVNGEPDGGEIKRTRRGKLLFHPHAHCLLHLSKGRLSPSAWRALLKNVWKFWRHHWDDGGVIRTAREAVKYVTKPGQVAALTPAECAGLYAQLRRLKLVHAMGQLAEEISARRDRRETLLREQTGDGYVWRVVKDWNRHAPKDVPNAFDEDGDPELDERMEKFLAEQMSGEKDVDADVCVVVARCAPRAAANCVKEPRVVVMGNRWDAARVAAHPLVAEMRERTREAWLAGCALIRVHTGTSTVASESPPMPFAFMSDLPPRVAPPGVPVFSP